MNKNFLRLPLILGIICALSTAIVSYANNLTTPVIAERRHKDIILGYTQVLPQAVNLEEVAAPPGSMITGIIRSEKDGQPNGYIYTVAPDGYSGQILLMVGISHPQAAISGVKILQQTETPGLGAKCTDPDFLSQFTGKPLKKKLVVKKAAKKKREVQAITASTITSNAVVRGINEARSHYFANYAAQAKGGA